MKNFISWFLFLFLCYDLVGCSSSQSPAKIEKDHQQEKNERNQVEQPTLDFGPGPTSEPIRENFRDRTKEFGLEGVEATHIYAVDFDNDGYTDIVVLPRFFSTPEFYRFYPEENKFKKLDYKTFKKFFRASYLAFVDLNQNGLLDVVLGTLNQKTALRDQKLMFFKAIQDDSNKIFYEQVDNNFPISASPTASISFVDIDLDGKLDLYMGNWYDTSGSPKPLPDNLLIAQERGFSFKDASAALKDEDVYSSQREEYTNAVPSFGVKSCDVDQDGFPDFLISGSSGFQNKLWMNRELGEGRYFEDYGESSNFGQDFSGRSYARGGGHSFYAACADYNNNGVLDLALGELTKSYDPEFRDRSSILTGKFLDDNPVYLRSEYFMDDGTGRWNQGDRRGVFVDFNVNGLADLVVNNSGFPPSSRLVVFEQQEDHGYVDVSEDLGINIVNPSGSVTIDAKKNGLMDLVVGQTDIRNSLIPARLYFFENVTPRNQKRSIRFFFRGEESNIRGIGALTRLDTENWESVRYHQPHYGPMPSQNEEGIHYGLGENNLPKKVEVVWPTLKDGQAQLGPLVVEYDLSKLFKDSDQLHYDLTLCEDGRLKKGLQSCSP